MTDQSAMSLVIKVVDIIPSQPMENTIIFTNTLHLYQPSPGEKPYSTVQYDICLNARAVYGYSFRNKKILSLGNLLTTYVCPFRNSEEFQN